MTLFGENKGLGKWDSVGGRKDRMGNLKDMWSECKDETKSGGQTSVRPCEIET